MGRPRTPCDNNMAQLFGIKTPVAAFMADSPILFGLIGQRPHLFLEELGLNLSAS